MHSIRYTLNWLHGLRQETLLPRVHRLAQFPLQTDHRADLILFYDFQMGFFDNVSLDHISSSALLTENHNWQKILSCKAGLPDKDIQFFFKGEKLSCFCSIVENKQVEIFTGEESITLPAFENRLKQRSFFPFFALCLQAGHALELSGFLSVLYSSMGSEAKRPAFLKYLIHLLK